MALPFELLDCIEFWARHRAESAAVSVAGRNMSYRELLAAIDCQAAMLEAVSNKRVAVLASAKLSTTLGVLSALRSGRSAVILNPQLPVDMLNTCVYEADPGAMAVAETDRHVWQSVVDRYEAMAALPRLALSEATGTIAGPAARGGIEADPDREWGVLYSSGSTGAPKGIERDFESMHTEFLGWCLELRLGTETRFYIGRPVFYTGGLVLTMSTLLAGGLAVLNEMDSPGPDALADDIARAATSLGPFDWVFLVPDQVRALLNAGAAGHLKGHVRGVLVMGAPISGREKLALAAAVGCTVRESWGNSESLGTITDDEMLSECPNSIGRPFLGDSMCVLDDEGELCPPGKIGRIAGGELAGFTRYTARPSDTAAAKQRGLIISEDLGWCDERGRFYIAGRIQERVTIGDLQVFLPQLEADIRGLGMTATFCLAHRIVGASGQLGLLFESGTSTEPDIRRYLAQIPVPVAVIGEVEKLFRTGSGKLDRAGAAKYLWPEM